MCRLNILRKIAKNRLALAGIDDKDADYIISYTLNIPITDIAFNSMDLTKKQHKYLYRIFDKNDINFYFKCSLANCAPTSIAFRLIGNSLARRSPKVSLRHCINVSTLKALVISR